MDTFKVQILTTTSEEYTVIAKDPDDARSRALILREHGVDPDTKQTFSKPSASVCIKVKDDD